MKTKTKKQNVSEVKQNENVPTISSSEEINHIHKHSAIQHTPTIRSGEIERPIAIENKGLDAISKSNSDIDNFYQKSMEQKWGLIDRITDRNLYKSVISVKEELFNTSSEYRLAFYKTILDTRIATLHERCDASLKMIKSDYRQKVSSFMMERMEQLTKEVKERQITFTEMMKDKYDYAETLTNYPSLKRKYLDGILIEEDKYLKFLASNLENFESIIDEQLKKYS